ncbi:MAG TPA: CRISPR system precrRNA processing endoribonuclease RAMP protein Cas6 [Chloroflexota bacterium]|nr:CRISPR system precrRNA processing endoribonuclease RAMP protein Cas6 [Chloroflexota bacterium]
MFDLAVHLLRFRAEVTSPLRLPPAAGAALRGALFAALRQQFCLAAGGTDCGRPAVAASCPVCFLLAPVEAGNLRGQDVPRPYVLRVPPKGPLAYAPGQTFEFGLATFGRALGTFPYALLGVQAMGERGLGAGRGGSFRLTEVWAENPLAGRQERIYRAPDRQVRTPALPIDAAQVAAEATALAAQLSAVSSQPSAASGARQAAPLQASPHSALSTQHSALRLSLRSPTRLIEAGRLVKPDSFQLRTLLARLLERLDALGARYGAGPTGADPAALLRQAEAVRIVERRLAWRDLFRASGRHGRMLPMGGLVGEVVLEGDLAPLLPWLVWGTLVHVGKDAAMGNGAIALAAL